MTLTESAKSRMLQRLSALIGLKGPREKMMGPLRIYSWSERRSCMLLRLGLVDAEKKADPIVNRCVAKVALRGESSLHNFGGIGHEVAFYTNFGAGLAGVLPPLLYAGQLAQKCHAIVLSEPMDTHAEWNGVPGEIDVRMLVEIVRSLSKIHAHLRSTEKLANPFFSAPYEVDLRDNPGLFKELTQHRIPRILLDLCISDKNMAKELFCPEEFSAMSMKEAICDRTVVHNDPNETNVLYPRDAPKNAYLLDWETWSYGPGTNDLAYLIVLCLSTEIRQECEVHLLKQYHRALIRHDFQNYSWSEFLEDYRWSVRRAAYVTLTYWARLGVPNVRVVTGLKRALAAIREWC